VSEQILHMIWTPLAPSPLLWLAVTLAAYLAGKQLQRACRGAAFASPVLIAIVIVAAVLLATGTPYATYFAGAQFIHFLLGPATVALAVPLARNLHHVRRNLNGIGLALLAGSVTSIVSGVAIVWLLGGSRSVALSMAPKAVTTPIAMGVSQQIGDPRRHHRRDRRPEAAAANADPRLARARSRRRGRRQWRGRRPGCRPGPARRGLRSTGDRPQRPADRAAGAVADAALAVRAAHPRRRIGPGAAGDQEDFSCNPNIRAPDRLSL
jgi:LrgB-like family